MTQVAIVGAGQAGTAAARRLCENGASVTLFEMADAAGAGLGHGSRQRSATVFHADPGRLWIYEDGQVSSESWEFLVLATGATPALAPAPNSGGWVEVGFLPDNRLAAALGCGHVFDAGAQWLLPVRDENLQSTIPGVYLAGAVAGDCTPAEAIGEGERVATAILGRAEGQSRSSAARAARWREAIPSNLPGDFEICPCSRVTVDEARDAIRSGAGSLYHLGQYGGAGMGHCRGRRCHPALAHLIATETGCALAEVLSPPFEFPAVAVPVSAFAALTPSPPPAVRLQRDEGRL